MNDIIIYTFETQGIAHEPVRLCVAAYNQTQALAQVNSTVYKVDRTTDIAHIKYADMKKSVQKTYAQMVENVGTVHRYEFATGGWKQI